MRLPPPLAPDVIQTEITRIRAACGDRVRFVLAGYSQGAWSVHQALYALDNASLGLISAVVLFGDPEFKPRQLIDRGSQKGLTNSGLATPIDASDTNVPPSLLTRTASYCLPHDPICQGVSPVIGLNAGFAYLAYCQAFKWKPGYCPHTSYAISGATDQAARFVRPLLAKVNPPQGNPPPVEPVLGPRLRPRCPATPLSARPFPRGMPVLHLRRRRLLRGFRGQLPYPGGVGLGIKLDSGRRTTA